MWVWPWRPPGVSSAAMPALATGVEVTYSQIGSRGLPWTSVKSSRTSRSGSAPSHARVSSLIVARVHCIAVARVHVERLDLGPAQAAASWLPRTPSAPTSRSRATTASGSGP